MEEYKGRSGSGSGSGSGNSGSGSGGERHEKMDGGGMEGWGRDNRVS
jgi:hypothetical protein